MYSLKRTASFVALTALVLAAGLMLLHRASPSPSGLVTVSILAITNDASRGRQATFRISNLGRHRVSLAPTFVLENHSGQWQTNHVPAGAVTLRTNLMGILPFHPRSKVLATSDSFEVTLPLPFDDEDWRVAFAYLEIEPALQDALRGVSRWIGLKSDEHGLTWTSAESSKSK